MTVSTPLTHLAGTVQAHRFFLLLRHNLSPRVFPPKLTEEFQGMRMAAATRIGVRHSWGMVANVGHLSTEDRPEDGRATLFDVVNRTSFQIQGLGIQATSLTERLFDGLAAAASTNHSSDTRAASEVDVLQQIREVLFPDATVTQQQIGGEGHIIVCTHGQRDCRCGDRGGALVDTLRSQSITSSSTESIPPLHVGEVAHVGQHKLAANVLIYPTGDWFGLVNEAHVPALLQYARNQVTLARRGEPATAPPPELVPHWRGGRGLDKAGQLSLAEEWMVEATRLGFRLPMQEN